MSRVRQSEQQQKGKQLPNKVYDGKGIKKVVKIKK